MTSTRIISEDSLQILLEAGNSIEVKNGYRTISVSSISSTIKSDDTIEIPDLLNSVETLQFCGFEAEAAAKIYQGWKDFQDTRWPNSLGYEEEIIEMARDYILGQAETCDAFSSSTLDDWDSALAAQGIADHMRARILDPQFEHIRLGACASEWALDTIMLSWEYLDGLDKRVKKSQDEKNLRSGSPDPSTKPSRALKGPSIRSGLHDGAASLKLAVDQPPPPELAGRSFFYKGGGYTRLKSIFNTDGSLDLTDIVSVPPCDFHPSKYDLCFTKQEDVARKYASYAHRRVPPQEPTIMIVAVPSDFCSSATQVFGSDWKKLVWYSRSKRALIANGGILPKELQVYDEAEVLIGNICYQSTHQIEKMKDYEELKYLTTALGNKASQVTLRGSSMFERFKTECRGFVWLETHQKKYTYFPPAA